MQEREKERGPHKHTHTHAPGQSAVLNGVVLRHAELGQLPESSASIHLAVLPHALPALALEEPIEPQLVHEGREVHLEVVHLHLLQAHYVPLHRLRIVYREVGGWCGVGRAWVLPISFNSTFSR